MADYVFSAIADQDIQDIYVYTALHFGEPQADSYTDQIHKVAQITADFPSMGLPYTTKKGRVFQKFSSGQHALFFQPMATGILVVRVLHLMMDFDRHLDGD